jgi:hypothetical protein
MYYIALVILAFFFEPAGDLRIIVLSLGEKAGGRLQREDNLHPQWCPPTESTTRSLS